MVKRAKDAEKPPPTTEESGEGADEPEGTPINYWQTLPFTKEDNKGGHLLEESSFAVLFPQYREKAIREAWPFVTTALKEVHIACKLDLIEGSMTVSTTRKTWDPFIIFKARDLIKLLARSVPHQQAVRILADEMQCDIVKVGNLVRAKDRFVKRRDRLVGPNGSTLKAIELLTGCYVLIHGNTVAAMGPYSGIKQVRRIAEDCMKNFHPIYHIKTLMIRRELAKDPTLQHENWERFLPNFKKAPGAKKTKGARDAPEAPGGSDADALLPAVQAPAKKKKREYTPFPPVQPPRKVDAQLESGEFFLTETAKMERKRAARSKKQQETVVQRKLEREQRFQPPAAAASAEAGERKKGKANEGESLVELGEKLKVRAASASGKKGRSDEGGSMDAFLGAGARKRPKA